MSDLTPKGFSNGQYVDRFLLRDKLYEEDAITIGGMATLNNFPAADVVPVVRCIDCKHWHRSLSDDGKIEFFNFSYCEKGLHGFPNFFCADGERKDGDGE